MKQDQKRSPSVTQRRRFLRLGLLGTVVGVGATFMTSSASPDVLAQTPLPDPEAAAQNASVVRAASYMTSTNITRKSWPLRAEVLMDGESQAITALPATAQLSGLRFQQQTFNNCGPASLSMVLSYFGRSETQADIAAVIKPYDDDKNVTPEELVSYASSIGYSARIIEGGDINLLKSFVANGLPVIAERWLDSSSDGEIGHFQVVMGYTPDQLIFFDSLQGEDIREPVNAFDDGWKVFNRHFVAFWPAEKASTVKALLGARWDEKAMLKQALSAAQAEADADEMDKFAWFNVGTNQVKLGNAVAAVTAYDTAIGLNLPERMLWYQFGIYEANLAVGNYEKVIQLTNDTIVTGGLEENHYWRGLAYSALGNQNAARRDFNRALQYNENFQAAEDALQKIDTLSYSP